MLHSRPLLIVVCILACIVILEPSIAGAQEAEKRSALLIANGAYSSFGSLANPVPETWQLATALRGLGFTVALVENASREAMLDALADFEAGLKKTGGIALFHYSGHGVQASGKNYLIPADADIPDERRLGTRAVDVEEIMASLDASGSSTNIVVLDACRNNPLPAVSGRSATKGLAVVGLKPKNSIIVYAAESNTSAYDGVFTPALIQAITRPGLSLNEVMMDVRSQVYQKTGGAQTPGEYNQLFKPVYLAGASGAQRPQHEVPAPAEASTTTSATPTFTVAQSYGSLTVKAASAGSLYVDGTKLGELPAGATATLGNIATGSRSLELRYSDGSPESKTVTVTEGRVTEVVFAWKKMAPVEQAPPSGVLSAGQPWTSPTGLKFMAVPAGSFQMGSPSGGISHERPVHQVTLGTFWLAATEVTQAQWQAVMGGNPSNTSHGIGPDNPVNKVSWYDALVFCNRLSVKEGLTPVYSIGGSTDPSRWGTVPTRKNSSWDTAGMNRGANGYRLPTEAEWEYAAKGGEQGARQMVAYAGSNTPDEVAWHSGNSGSKTQPVGLKKPNQLGLFDMSGNVWEWCWDWNGRYISVSQTDPAGPPSGDFRMTRGGGWSCDTTLLRTTDRTLFKPWYQLKDLGFRLARSLPS